MNVVGAVRTLAETLACLETAKPDVILLAHIDHELGRDAIPKINAVSQAKILVFAAPREPNLREAAILGGARGVVDKDAEREAILKAIRKVHEGEVWLDRVAAARVFAELSRRCAEEAANPLAHGPGGRAEGSGS